MKLDIGRCFEQAWDIFLKNWLILILAGLLNAVLSAFTLLILAGPLAAGFSLMALNAVQREDHRVELGDMFGMFHRFFGLVGLFFLMLIAEAIGLGLCLVPGLFLMTIWMFPFFIVVDQRTGVIDALGRSQEMAFQAGFWNVVVLMLVELALDLLPNFIPYAGVLVSFATTPLATLVVAVAYRQLTTARPEVPVEALPPQAI